MTPRDGPRPGAGATRYDAAPDAALAAIRAFDGPVLLDLDETLYLGNSTEDFIDSARPGVLAVVLLKLLDAIAPWRWTGGEATRDAWRVRIVMLLMPWTPRRWRQRVGPLVEQFGNAALVGALRARATRPIIVTRGFGPIVTPLVAAFNLGEAGIVATWPERLDDRLAGKHRHAVDALGADTVRRALVLTDSTDDLPLLEACARPLRTVWPQARYRPAFGDIYLPGRYITRVERAGERRIVRGILQEDFALWLLGSIALAAHPVLHTAGLLFLLLSFWAIYECGYVDTDRIAARREREPRLDAAIHAAPVPTPRWAPWIWALLSGAVAIQLLRWPAPAMPADVALWLGVLLATHGWFLLYNRFDPATRVWLHPGLQLARSAAFCALVPVAVVGAAALGAHVLAKWVPHAADRRGNKESPRVPVSLARLLFFVVLALLLAVTQGPAALATWTAAALLAWNLLHARAELAAAAARARRIDRAPPELP